MSKSSYKAHAQLYFVVCCCDPPCASSLTATTIDAVLKVEGNWYSLSYPVVQELSVPCQFCVYDDEDDDQHLKSTTIQSIKAHFTDF